MRADYRATTTKLVSDQLKNEVKKIKAESFYLNNH